GKRGPSWHATSCVSRSRASGRLGGGHASAVPDSFVALNMLIGDRAKYLGMITESTELGPKGASSWRTHDRQEMRSRQRSLPGRASMRCRVTLVSLGS